MKRKLSVILIVSASLALSSFADAHMLWLNAKDYSPSVGEDVYVEIGFGHEFPCDEYIREGVTQRFFAVDPDGKEIELTRIFRMVYKFIPQKAGAYKIVMEYKPGFMTITKDHKHLLQTKKGVENVQTSFQYILNAKAVIIVGKKDKGLVNPAGETLEIIAMKSPADLREGDVLPVKVMFEGKPLAGAMAQALDVDHSSGKEQKWSQPMLTNQNGEALIKLDGKGQWIVKIEHSTPYPDKSEADEYSYRTTLTLSVK
jgi:uncharacterized GH25 family protein